MREIKDWNCKELKKKFKKKKIEQNNTDETNKLA